ncbi:MAG: hypothetical protein ACUVWN_14820 [bacterium]
MKIGLKNIKINFQYFVKIFCFVLFIIMIIKPEIPIAQINNDTMDIKDAIAIVSNAMGVKIIVDGDIKGRVRLDLDNLSPRQIRDQLEKALKESGYSWISEAGIVKISKNGRIRSSLYGSSYSLSYYIDVISRNNLFLPLVIEKPESKAQLILRGVFGIGDSKKAIIEDTASGKSYYISEGESLGQQKIVSIGLDQVILVGPNGSINLKIPKK